MKKIIINNKEYRTNVNGERLEKCKKFYSDGCTSYVISFDNHVGDVIEESKLDNCKVLYLRNMNFNSCCLPKIAKDFKTAKQIIENGLDIIELI
jgi:hypothetical protein